MYLDWETGRVVSVGYQEEYVQAKEKYMEYEISKWTNNYKLFRESFRNPNDVYKGKIDTIIGNVQKELDILANIINNEEDSKTIKKIHCQPIVNQPAIFN